jgi:G3E family GTPase
VPRYSDSDPVPVTILTGSLGAGKTTLLNTLLTAGHGYRIAAIINEFGEIGIDGDLVVNVEGDEVYTLSNGCICCTVREDLLEVVEGLLYGGGAFDHILIETTGIAEPGPVVMGLLNHPEITESFTLDGVITVIDARHLPLELASGTEAESQIAWADRILLNKIDLVAEGELEMVEDMIRSINPVAPITRTLQAVSDVDDLLDIGGFSAGSNISETAKRLEAATESVHHHTTRNGNGITAVALRMDGAVDGGRLDAWLPPLLEARHRDIYRMKGILRIAGVPAPLVVQGVHGLYTSQFGPLREGIAEGNRLVFIGRSLDRAELESGLTGCISW